MVATNSLSLTGVVIVILHVTYSDNKFKSKNSRARERHDGKTSHSLLIFPAVPPCSGDGLHFLPTHSNTHHTTNTYKKNIQDRTLRELCSRGTSFT
jgi:hypothetical protein